MALVTLSDEQTFSARKIYDSADVDFQNGDANTGLTVNAPHVVEVSAVPATTTVQVQAKLHASAAWVPVAEFNDVADPQLVIFDPRMNYVQVIRTAGTDAITAYSQG